MTSIKRVTLQTPKQVASVFDPGYLGVEWGETIQNKTHPRQTKRNETQECLKRKKTTAKAILKRRIAIEHTICKIKKRRVLAYMFRSRLINYNRHQTSCLA